MEYVNELADVRPANIIPDFVTSVNEASQYVDEATDRYISKVLHSVSLAESRYYQQTGTKLILSEADESKKGALQKIKDTIVNLFKKVWGFIQAAWEKVLTAIKKVCAQFTMSDQDVANKLKYFKGDKNRTAGSVHEFGGLDDLTSKTGSYANIINKGIVNMNNYASVYRSASDINSYSGSGDRLGKTDYDKSAYTKASVNLLGGNPGKDPDLEKILGTENKQAAVNAIVEKVEGKIKDVSIGDLIRSFDVYVQFGTNYSVVSKNAKGMYDDQKRQINAAIKTVKSLRNIDPKPFTKYTGRLSTAMTILTNAATRALADKNREYAKLVATGRRLVLKAKKGDFAESAEMHTGDPLDSLFAE